MIHTLSSWFINSKAYGDQNQMLLRQLKYLLNGKNWTACRLISMVHIGTTQCTEKIFEIIQFLVRMYFKMWRSCVGHQIRWPVMHFDCAQAFLNTYTDIYYDNVSSSFFIDVALLDSSGHLDCWHLCQGNTEQCEMELFLEFSQK